jgi:outer membrane receptor protein involved in Fe transport
MALFICLLQKQTDSNYFIILTTNLKNPPMKKLFTLSLLFFTITFSLLAQQATIKGKVTNAKTRETIPGVNVLLNPTTGVVTDIDGNYTIRTEPGRVKLTFKYMGFTTLSHHYDLKAGQVLIADIEMSEESMVIEGVVVSAGKFEQKLSDVTISMEVLRPDQIENQNTNDMSEALSKIPGLTFTTVSRAYAAAAVTVMVPAAACCCLWMTCPFCLPMPVTLNGISSP